MQNICNYNLNSENTECNYEILPGTFNLQTGSREDFVTAFEENNSFAMLNQFLLEVNDPSADINTLADNLSNIILNAANKTLHFKQFKRKKKRKRYKQKWFNSNCHFLKRYLNSNGKKLKQHPDNFDLRTSFHRMRKEYKKY